MLETTLGISHAQVIAFGLIFVRISALLFTAPIFGSRAVPARLRILIAFVLSVTMLPKVKTGAEPADLLYAAGLLALAKEAAVGLFLGFSMRMVFEVFQIAGRVIGTQMGLGVAELIDPDNGAQSSPIGNLLTLTATVLFLQLNGHHVVIRALNDSFRLVPLSSAQFMHAVAARKVTWMFNDVLAIAIRMAAPTMVAFFLVERSMGIMARLAPQMNVFFIGLPLRLGLGLFILINLIPLFYLFFSGFMVHWKQDIKALLLTF